MKKIIFPFVSIICISSALAQAPMSFTCKGVSSKSELSVSGSIDYFEERIIDPVVVKLDGNLDGLSNYKVNSSFFVWNKNPDAHIFMIRKLNDGLESALELHYFGKNSEQNKLEAKLVKAPMRVFSAKGSGVSCTLGE